MTKARGVSCRGCWQPQPADALRLSCGDVFCGGCLASLVRAGLQSPASLLPLRCCQQFVPPELVAASLKPEEFAFYRFLTAQEAAAKRTRVTAHNQALLANCNFCSRQTPLVIAKDANELLLDCGHVYCRACLEAARKAAPKKSANGVVCCQALMDTTPVTKANKATRAAGVSGAAQVKAAAPVAPHRRVSPRLKVSDAAAASGGKPGEAPQQPQCTACMATVDAAAACAVPQCGHVLCFACVKQRCQRALTNEAQGSIGFPIRCCHHLVALDAIQPALTKREFLQYEALVAKRGDAKPVRCSTKRKAEVSEAPAVAPQPEPKRPSGRPPKAKPMVPDPEPPQEDCVACVTRLEATTETFRGPCGHGYCVTCVGMMAKESLEDRSRVPIRCCSQEFPIEYVKSVLPKTKMAQYERFLEEKDWRASDLKSDKEYAREVKKLNGKMCPTCGIGVEKIGGCDAMRCVHGHHFCWKCGSAPCVCGRTQLEQYGWIPPAAPA